MKKSANISKVKAMASRAQARTNAPVRNHPAKRAARETASVHKGKTA